jgi:glycosyltransferase involved in cell wall biosynthesis
MAPDGVLGFKRIALVHDYLVQDGGAERVLACFQRMFPDAPTYVLLHDARKRYPPFGAKDIRTSFLDNLPFSTPLYQWYMPLMPRAIEQLDLSEFDLVISSSSSFAKGVILSPETTHVCYCHTPTRFLWQERFGYLHDAPQPWIMRVFLPSLLHRLRTWDRLAAERPDVFVTNSQTSKTRIRHFYNRDATVISPPVDVGAIPLSTTRGSYWLAGGRLVKYKRFDLLVRAFAELDLPLKIFGVGPERKRLRAMAGPNTEMLGHVSDEEKRRLYRDAIAFLNPQIEDFGITAVEAMAAGKPVLAYGKGGATETVVPGVTGAFIAEQTPESVIEAVRAFRPESYDPARIRTHAETFSAERFEERFRALLGTIKPTA